MMSIAPTMIRFWVVQIPHLIFLYITMQVKENKENKENEEKGK